MYFFTNDFIDYGTSLVDHIVCVGFFGIITFSDIEKAVYQVLQSVLLTLAERSLPLLLYRYVK